MILRHEIVPVYKHFFSFLRVVSNLPHFLSGIRLTWIVYFADFWYKMILHIFILLCTKCANFAGNSFSWPSTESPCPLLSIGTFRFLLQQFFLSKLKKKNYKSTIDFCRLKLLGCRKILCISHPGISCLFQIFWCECPCEKNCNILYCHPPHPPSGSLFGHHVQ